MIGERGGDGRGWQKGQTGWERPRHGEGISGVALGLRRVSVADGYLGIPVHRGLGRWTGSGRDVSSQAAVGLEIEDVEWIEGSSWCVPVMLSGWTQMSPDKVLVKMKRELNSQWCGALYYVGSW